MTVIFFAGPRLDHGDADQYSSVEADYLERRDARPPVVVRGYGVAGHPVSVIRAGKRIEDAVLVAAADLVAYGFNPADTTPWWRYPARDASGAAVEGITRRASAGVQFAAPPFDFRPAAVIPMPDGRLLCLAAPLVEAMQLAPLGSGPPRPVFRDFYRVYRRNGDWIQDFPALHGGPIHDAFWDDAGACFIAGDDVGDERYSFRKYNRAYELQWSVSFYEYWPLSTVAVRTTQGDFNNTRAQFDQRRASVKISPNGDGSFNVISEISFTLGGTNSSGFRFYHRIKRFGQIARVSAAGEIVWVRVFEKAGLDFTQARGEPSRKSYSCQSVDSGMVFLFFTDAPASRYSVGQAGGNYGWDYYYQAGLLSEQYSYQALHDYYYQDKVDWQNGMAINADGGLVNHLFPSTRVIVSTVTLQQGILLENAFYPHLFLNSVMRYANERLTVWSRRVRWYGDSAQYNVDPEYVRHVFYKDMTLLSETETPAFDPLDGVAIAEDGSVYYGRRAHAFYEDAFDPLLTRARDVIVAMHFRSEDGNGDSNWNNITATAQLGVNAYGKLWRDFGRWRIVTDEPRAGAISPSDTTSLPKYQAAHNDFAVFSNAHGALTSGDFIALSGFSSAVDFWSPAADVVIAYDSPTPALALPVFLGGPYLAGPVNSLPPALALPLALRAPTLRREYVGPPLPQIFRLTLGDLGIPFSTLIVRKTAFEVTVSAVCPAASEPLVAAILARDTETLTVWRGILFRDGREALDVMIAGALAGLRYDRGVRSGSITLDVRQEPAATPARLRPLSALTRLETRSGGRSYQSSLPDIFLNPGDTAAVGSISFVVGRVEYLIGPNEARMTVGEQS